MFFKLRQFNRQIKQLSTNWPFLAVTIFGVILLVSAFGWLNFVQAQDDCPEQYVICGENQSCSSIWFHGEPPCCEGKCLDPINFCAGQPEETVTPTSNSVTIELCTNPESICTTRLFYTQEDYNNRQYFASQTDKDEKAEHSFTFNNLDADTEYFYDITCQKSGDYADLYSNGNFTTEMSANYQTENLEISDYQVKAGVYKATFSWKTNKPATSKVFINGQEKKSDDNLVAQHNLEVTGLNPSTTYRYYLMSATQTSGSCGAGVSNADCAATSGNDEFTTLDADTSPDANVILRVNRDRICNKWLYCNAGVEVLNTSKNPPAKEDVCFSIGLCGALDEGGNCSNILDNELNGELTYKQPTEISKIKNLSGYSKVGLDWGKRCTNNGLQCQTDSDCGSGGSGRAQCVDAKIAGYYPYNTMPEVGMPINVANYNFEDGTARPWQVWQGAERYNVNDIGDSNRILEVKVKNKNDGIRARVTDKVNPQGVYVISFVAKTDNQDGMRIKVQLKPETGDYYRFNYYNPETKTSSNVIDLKNYWQEYIMSLDMGKITQAVGGAGDILFTLEEENKSAGFYVDNIQMKSVLKVSDPLNYISRSCRMYPDKNALACDYYDEQKDKEMHGWKGYCVEPDPAYSDQRYAGHPVCLQWWPVDIIAGESNVFSNEPVVGYAGRKPLYYCLQAKGDYPYVKTVKQDFNWGSHSCCTDDLTVDVSNLNIYRDDIQEIRIENVQIDRNNDNFSDMVCRDSSAEQTKYVNANPSKAGVIIFNELNKAHWNFTWGSAVNYRPTYIDDDGQQQNAYYEGQNDCDIQPFNPYASLKCKNYYDHDTASALLIWDGDHLTGIDFKECDVSKGDGSGRYDYVRIILKGERCDYLARVVTEDGENKAWVTRVQKDGWTKDNYLGYSYNQDYAPYGASVVPSGLPEDWEEPLYVMPADKTLTQPYQVRAGAPYASPKPIKTQCIAGSAERLGKDCKSNDDCGLHGECMGINLSKQANNFLTNSGGDAYVGIANLSPLFVKSYGVWHWDANRHAYVRDYNMDWDYSYPYSVSHPLGRGVLPKVNDILVNNRDDADFEIVGQGAAMLKFTSWVNPDQVPLVSYSVDWGDNKSTTESGLKIAPKSNLENPHILVHYYKYDKNCADAVKNDQGDILYCRYKPLVTIKDNWGLTGDKEFDQYIRVYPAGTVLGQGVLDVNPTQLTYYSTSGMPQSQTFTVSNTNIVGNDLNWQIVDNGTNFFGTANGADTIKYKFEDPYDFGYQDGKLPAGAQSKVYFTVTDIGSASVGTYNGQIIIRTLDNSQEKTVNIKLVIGNPS